MWYVSIYFYEVFAGILQGDYDFLIELLEFASKTSGQLWLPFFISFHLCYIHASRHSPYCNGTFAAQPLLPMARRLE
jgi:hypothetical protein